MVLNHVYSPQR